MKRNRVRKMKINRIEMRKGNFVDELHWKTISRLLKMNDFIFYCYSVKTFIFALRSQLQNANVQNHEVIFHCVLVVRPIASPNQFVPQVGQTGVKSLSI